MTKKSDPINPAHYQQGKLETIDHIEDIICQFPEQVDSFLAGNVIKYLARAPHKGFYVEDLKKAKWYLDRLVKHQEK